MPGRGHGSTDATAAVQPGQHQDKASSDGRAAIACVNCASTKTKCDRRYPCGRCCLKHLTCVSRHSRRGKKARTTEYAPCNDIVESASARFPPITTSINLPTSWATTSMPINSWSEAAIATQSGSHCHLNSSPNEALTDHQSLEESSQSTQARDWAARPAADMHASKISEGVAASSGGEGLLQTPGLYSGEWDTSLFNLGWSPANYPPIDTVIPESADLSTSPVNRTSSLEDSHPFQFSDTTDKSTNYDEEKALLTRDWEHWSICRCSPVPVHAAEDRTKSSIVTLDHNFVRAGPWSAITESWREENFETGERFVNIALSDTTREWLLVIAQRAMRVAMDVHGLTLDSPSPASLDAAGMGGLGGYVRLPPSQALHKYLETVLRRYEPFYPLIPARTLDPNQLLGAWHGRGSSLLLFLMFAFGSMLDPAVKARRLSTALTEICRHSIQEVLERDPGVPGSGLLFYGSLMFTIKSAFSGDKAHMNIAIAHRHMYLTSMRSAGVFRRQKARTNTKNETLKQAWQSWIEFESVSRLAYGWVVIENEISLFYDCQPILNTSEMETILPAEESLWLASTADEWQRALCTGRPVEEWRDALRQQPEHSLRTLFQLLMDDQLDCPNYQPSILHMKILLYPLHVLVAQLGQLLDCGMGAFQSRGFSNPVTHNSSILRFSEIQQLLEIWYNAFIQLDGHGSRFSALKNATNVMYHLINLNLYTAFGRMERFARESYMTWKPGTPEKLFEVWIRAPEQALVHCGQILRLFREISEEMRPVWSTLGIYRATIIMWAFSISRTITTNEQTDRWSGNDQIAIDILPFRHQTLQNYLRGSEAKPILTNCDGSEISLEDPKTILKTIVELLSRGCLVTSFSAGIRCKLADLAQV